MPFCDICGEYKYTFKEHKCPPMYEVFNEDMHIDQGRIVRAFDEEDAATKFAEKEDIDSAEYTVANGGEMELLVRKVGESEWKKFVVTAEITAVYSASSSD